MSSLIPPGDLPIQTIVWELGVRARALARSVRTPTRLRQEIDARLDERGPRR
jgi:hypothetical protein